MEKEFVDYNSSLSLKELGYNEHAIAYYLKNGICEFAQDGPNRNEDIDKWKYSDAVCCTILYQQAFRFFREKYRYNTTIEYNVFEINCYEAWVFPMFEGFGFDCGNHKTYEEAEQACLLKLIEIAKENKQ